MCFERNLTSSLVRIWGGKLVSEPAIRACTNASSIDESSPKAFGTVRLLHDMYRQATIDRWILSPPPPPLKKHTEGAIDR